MKIAAKIISVLFHPIWMPLFGFWAVMYGDTYAATMHQKIKWLIIVLMALVTVLLPLTSVPLLINFKKIRSIDLDNKNERIIPLMISLLSYLFAIYAFRHLNIRLPYLLLGFLVGAGFTNLFLLVINFWWKISVHMAGIGGMLALLFVVSWVEASLSPWYFVALVGLSGWVASSRLLLNAHTLAQVLAGAALGFGTVLGVMLLF